MQEGDIFLGVVLGFLLLVGFCGLYAIFQLFRIAITRCLDKR